MARGSGSGCTTTTRTRAAARVDGDAAGAELLTAIEAEFGRYLYHGGPGGVGCYTDTLASFQKHGISPDTTYRTEPTTYLVTNLPGAYGYACDNGDEEPGPVFRIDLHSLDGSLLRGDEWHLLPDPRYPAWQEADWDMEFPVDGFGDPADVLASLRKAGQLAYAGAIPPEALELVADAATATR
jgi:hypothetical protein